MEKQQQNLFKEKMSRLRKNCLVRLFDKKEKYEFRTLL